MKFSITHLFFLALSFACYIFEFPTVVYLWCNDKTMQSTITSTWVTYHVGDENNGMSIMYIFVLLLVMLPRLFLLYLPMLEPLLMYSSLLSFINFCVHFHLLSHVWMASTYDIAYVSFNLLLSVVLFIRFFALVGSRNLREYADLERQVAERQRELQRIRAMRAARSELHGGGAAATKMKGAAS